MKFVYIYLSLGVIFITLMFIRYDLYKVKKSLENITKIIKDRLPMQVDSIILKPEHFRNVMDGVDSITTEGALIQPYYDTASINIGTHKGDIIIDNGVKNVYNNQK